MATKHLYLCLPRTEVKDLEVDVSTNPPTQTDYLNHQYINRILCGDNLDLLKEIPDESVDLVYIDPPFFTSKQYEVIWGDGAEKRAFDDRWVKSDGTGRYSKDINVYLEFMEPRLREIHRVLKPTGSFYLHCDWHADSYLRCLCDTIFGYDNLFRKITWKRTNGGKPQTIFGVIDDTILIYQKTGNIKINQQYIEYTEEQLKKYNKVDKNGKKYYRVGLDARGSQKNENRRIFTYRGCTGMWRCSEKTLEEYYNNDILDIIGGMLYKKIYPTLGIPVSNIWDDISLVGGEESLGYPTQKPEALLERIIKASSNDGDVILDAFCYSDDTEVLTDMGWKFFYELNKNEKIACINPETDYIEYHFPNEWQTFEYTGTMFNFKNRELDILVTPDHSMYVSKRHTYRDGNFTLWFEKYILRRAENVKSGDKIKRACNGINTVETAYSPPTKTDLHNWCKFIGFYIGDGTYSKNNRICIKVSLPHKVEFLKTLEYKIPFMYLYQSKTVDKEGRYYWYFCSKSGHPYGDIMTRIGKTQYKNIPREMLNLPKEYLYDILIGLQRSDGNSNLQRNMIIYTSSKILVDNITELMIKCGLSCSYSTHSPKSFVINSNHYTGKLPCYTVHVQPKTKESHITTIQKVKYSGKVYCVTVQTHVIIVRRNGKPFFCGNCGCGTTLAVAKRLSRRFIGIDISPTACRLVAQRIAYPLNKIIGLPMTPDEIKELTGFEFQNAVMRLLDPLLKLVRPGRAGADGGLDGIYGDVPIQVKKYHAGRGDLDGFSGTLLREQKKEGIFIALGFTADFKKEAARLKRVNNITIHQLTFQDLIDNKQQEMLAEIRNRNGSL